MKNLSLSKSGVLGVLLVLLVSALEPASAGNLPAAAKSATTVGLADQSAGNASNATEMSRQSELEQNPLRIGFEPFYQFTNMFIDNAMHFDIPQKLVDLFVNLTQSDSVKTNPNAVINEIKSYYEIHDNLKFISTLPFKISTNFSIMAIICVLFVVAVPIAGLFLCMCRLCLRSKFNPYDRKNDSAKRKLLATIIFGLVVLLLLSSVILFFTNQNANNAIQKSPLMIKSSVLKIKALAVDDTPNYLQELIKNLQSAKSNTSVLIKNFTQKINEDIKKNIFSGVIAVLNDTNEIVNSTSTVISDINSQAKILGEAFAVLRTEILKTSSPELRSEVNKISVNFKIDSDMNATDIQLILREIMKKPDDLLTSILQTLTDKIDSTEIAESIDNKIESIDTFIQLLKSNETMETIDRGENLTNMLKLTANVYENIYYVLVGICVFMLLWFILYTMGLAGLCARRANDSYSQLFHRGVSANLLMTGASFFFIFSSVLMIVCIVLYTPGILMRQYIAKPLMNPDSNPAIKAAFLPALENTSLTNFFNECRQKKPILSIREADEIFKEITLVDLANLTSSGLIKPFIDKKREQLQLNLRPIPINSTSIEIIFSDLLSQFNKVKADVFVKEAEEVKLKVDDLSTLALEITKDRSSLDNAWRDFVTGLDTMTEKLKSLRGWQKLKNTEISELKNKTESMLAQYNSQKEFNRLFNEMVNKTLEEEVMPNLNSVLSDILLIHKSPTCAPIAQIYDDLVTSFCFEFLDNFNTYWFFLLLSLGVHLVLLGFAISLADLLRKFYAYDEVLTEDIVMDDATKPYDGYSDQHHLKEGYNGKSPNGLIDAYEMHQQMKRSNRSPPPQYRVTRA